MNDCNIALYCQSNNGPSTYVRRDHKNIFNQYAEMEAQKIYLEEDQDHPDQKNAI